MKHGPFSRGTSVLTASDERVRREAAELQQRSVADRLPPRRSPPDLEALRTELLEHIEAYRTGHHATSYELAAALTHTIDKRLGGA